MASVHDLWFTIKDGKKEKSSRHGCGKRWVVKWRENGRQRNRAFTSKSEADVFASRVEVAIADGTWISKEKSAMTVADFYEAWIATKQGKAEKTILQYESFYKNHVAPKWGRMRVQRITRAMVEAWLPTISKEDGSPVGASCARQCGLILQGLLDIAVEHRAILSNPMRLRRGLLPQNPPTSRKMLSMTEVDQLRAALPTEQAQLLFDVLLYTGLRPGEAKGLKVGDLDVGRKRLRVQRQVDDLGKVKTTKTGRHREVPLPAVLLTALLRAAEGKAPDDWLVVDEYGHLWTNARWRKIWSNARCYTGIDCQLYALRHTAVSIAIASGAEIKTVQAIAGHASAQMTLDVYGHLYDKKLDELPAMMERQMEAMRIAEQAQQIRISDQEAQARRAAFRVVK